MKHFYKGVPGWAAFGGLYVDMVKRAPADKPSNFVEIGSWLGRSACLMGVEIVNSRKHINLTCVDPWVDGGPDLRETKYFKELHGKPYDLFLRNINPVAQVIKAMKMPSLEAARFVPDKSVDFIMIDGDHSYEAVRDDIAAWLPKMKPGSIMSGDDFMWPGVKQAVEEVFPGRASVVHIKKSENYLNSASYWTVQL